MRVGCKYKFGDIIRGLKVISEPYKIDGEKSYRAEVQCTFCNREIQGVILNKIDERVFDGCGCQKSRKNSSHWQSFADWCIENNSSLLDLWDYDLNEKGPYDISYCTADCYYFKCDKGKHPSEQYKISSLTRHASRSRSICTKCLSFAQYGIDLYGDDFLDLYWDYANNTVDPWAVAHGSHVQIWIKCQTVDYHSSYSTDPVRFFKGVRCPFCNGKKIHPNDSFAKYYIEKYGDDFLGKFWDYEKNKVNPWELAKRSNKSIWLKCDEHGSYNVSPNNLDKREIPLCPCCQRDLEKSGFQLKTEEYIYKKYEFEMLHESKCTIMAKNPKTNKAMPYDNDIILPNGKHLIIEVHGRQHYEINDGWNKLQAQRNGITQEEALTNLKWRDEYKKQYALDNGYFYIALPYWAFKDESYKSLIDQQIHKILQC